MIIYLFVCHRNKSTRQLNTWSMVELMPKTAMHGKNVKSNWIHNTNVNVCGNDGGMPQGACAVLIENCPSYKSINKPFCGDCIFQMSMPSVEGYFVETFLMIFFSIFCSSIYNSLCSVKAIVFLSLVLNIYHDSLRALRKRKLWNIHKECRCEQLIKYQNWESCVI